MTENELIEEAKNKGFIKGARIDNSKLPHTCGKITLVSDKYKYYKVSDIGDYLRCGDEKIWSSESGWAIVLSYPEGYIPKSTNLLKQIEIW